MKTHRSMTSSSADPSNGEKGRQEAGLHCTGYLSLARQFLQKRLTCQSVIDPVETGLSALYWTPVSFLGTAPPDRGQVGWSRINHSLFPCLQASGKSPVKAHPTHPETHTRTGCLSSFSSTLSIFLSPPNLILCLFL